MKTVFLKLAGHFTPDPAPEEFAGAAVLDVEDGALCEEEGTGALCEDEGIGALCEDEGTEALCEEEEVGATSEGEGTQGAASILRMIKETKKIEKRNDIAQDSRRTLIDLEITV